MGNENDDTTPSARNCIFSVVCSDEFGTLVQFETEAEIKFKGLLDGSGRDVQVSSVSHYTGECFRANFGYNESETVTLLERLGFVQPATLHATPN